MKSVHVYFLDFVAFLYLLRSHNHGAFEKLNNKDGRRTPHAK